MQLTPENTEFITGRFNLWYNDFSIMVEDVFGVVTYDNWVNAHKSNPQVPHQEKWQSDFLSEIHEAPRDAIKSGKGVGKTALVAWVILCYLGTRKDTKLLVTAPTASQLKDVLWAECNKWIRKMNDIYLPLFEYVWTSERITLKGREDEGFATARTARKEQPEAFQGFHEDNMVLIGDEAAGIDNAIYEAGEGTMSTEGAKTILVGNPNRTNGYFYECFNRDSVRWRVRTIACTESSRVTQDYIDGMKHKWGEESNEYRIGVLGEFPLGNAQGVIPRNIIDEASRRPSLPSNPYPLVWGLDVARFGSDRTALCERRGAELPATPQWWQGKDLMQTANLISDKYFALPQHERPVEICIDVIGVGGGVVDRLRELKLPVKAVNVAHARTRPGYRRLRDELWFRAREWFEDPAAKIPDPVKDKGIVDLMDELSAVEYDIDGSGNKFLTDKAALGYSPDLADSFILTFGGSVTRYTSEADHARVANKPSLQYAQSNARYMRKYR